MKATAVAPSNIAFIKYWGKKDEILKLPENGSVSMNLNNLLTTTTIDFSETYKSDEVLFNGTRPKNVDRIINHLNLIRNLSRINLSAKVVTNNNFPTAVGIASSASGFAALTVACDAALNLNLSEKQLSILARQGSGSACRSIPSGFIEWLDGDTSETSYAVSLYPPDYWDIVDVVVIIDDNKKNTPSNTGQKSAQTSPFFPARLANTQNNIRKIKTYLADKNFKAFGELIETEALELHAVMLTSQPPLIYIAPQTLSLIKWVWKARKNGLPIYFTIDAGPNMHLICEKKNCDNVVNLLKEVNFIKQTIVNYPAKGTRTISKHLF